LILFNLKFVLLDLHRQIICICVNSRCNVTDKQKSNRPNKYVGHPNRTDGTKKPPENNFREANISLEGLYNSLFIRWRYSVGVSPVISLKRR